MRKILEKAYHKVGKTLMQYKVKSVNIDLDIFQENTEAMFQAAVEGLLQSEYAFDKYLSKKKVIPTVENVYVKKHSQLDFDVALKEILAVYKGVTITRNLVNERAKNMYPEVLANSAKSYLRTSWRKSYHFR